jgi:hypothetical protein
MRNSLAVCLMLASGCERTDPLYCGLHPGENGCPDTDGGTTDGRQPDASVDAAPRLCYGASTFAFCLPSEPATPIGIADGAQINTDTDSRCQASPAMWTATGQPDSCFIIGESITLVNTPVVGSKPLVLVAARTITISGTLDVASHRVPAKIGPAAESPDCPDYLADPQSDGDDGNSGGAGGGAGASFITAGQNGGTGNLGDATEGTAFAVLPQPTLLRPGCIGQTGGKGDGDSPGGIGGFGGGAVFLIAGDMISFGAMGAIDASGAGAIGSGDQAGGGGGGSGGMVVLYSDKFSAAAGAKIMANGGAGGSGANNGGGTPGADPLLASPTVPATGVGAPCGGCGTAGSGFAGVMAATVGGPGGDGRSGGGGGGGGGYIVANKPLLSVVTSPVATIIAN